MASGKARKRAALAGAQNWRCAYCQGMMDEGKGGLRAATIEHLVARSRGGSEHSSNLVAACGGCNGGRPSHHSALQFFELRQELLTSGLWPECTLPSRAIIKHMQQLPGRREGCAVRFALEDVFEHVERHHPGCPSVFRGELAHLVAQRRWIDASIGKAFGIIATGFVRNAFTDYEHLRQLEGMTDAEARLIIRPKVARILASWRWPEASSEASLKLPRCGLGG